MVAGTLAIVLLAIGDPGRFLVAPAWVAFGWTLVAMLGLWRGRVWGLFALMGAGAALVSSAQSLWWAAAAIPIFGAFARHLPALLRADRGAALVLAALFAVAGGATGLAPVQLAEREQPTSCPVARPSREVAAVVTHEVQVSIEEVRGERALRVTLRNPGPEPLALDVPKELGGPHPWHSPLLDPLLRIEAFDAQGRRLKHVRSFGCGMVYSSTKVVLRVLPPGGTSVHVIDLPDAWYPESAVLPEYSHAMLMNPEEVESAPRPIPATRALVRVAYDSASLSGSWRNDLSTGLMSRQAPVHGTSAGIVVAY
ncbi:MAG: hypothetical protein HYY06_22815 [Deltaproteobacteria bacterium]|nr:hypothetical protein [Deltaproteobacteria bacterium]